jgi:hypothetical protein
MVPPYPVKGQKVTFAAFVKNQGTGPTTGGATVKVSFKLDGEEKAFAENFTGIIPPGGMAFIEADGGPTGTNQWNADSLGTFVVSAEVDPGNTVDECVEENNGSSAILKVYPQPMVNIALNKPVIVSSVENTALAGKNAVDGNYSTRWSSAHSDPQYIVVDLGSVKTLHDLLLYWEAAYAKVYQVMVSDDNVNFKTIFTESNGDGGIDKIVTSEQCRYVKIFGVERGTQWGYSLYEIVVHAESTSDAGITMPPVPSSFALLQNYPNPFNPSTMITYHVPEQSQITLTVHDVLGKVIAVLVNETKIAGEYTALFDGSGHSSGVYFYTLRTEKFTQTKKCILLK